MSKSLRSLNLSHNRIVSLMPLRDIAEISVLKVIDLTDNYIGELSNIKHLAKFDHLRELSFQKIGDDSKGKNPICDFVNYRDTIQMFLPKLEKVDGFDGSGQKPLSQNTPIRNDKQISRNLLGPTYSNTSPQGLGRNQSNGIPIPLHGPEKVHANTTAAMISL